MLTLMAPPASLPLTGGNTTTYALARFPATRLKGIQSHLGFLDVQQVRHFVNHAAIFRRIDDLYGLTYSSQSESGHTGTMSPQTTEATLY